jgi:hypothetical protein
VLGIVTAAGLVGPALAADVSIVEIGAVFQPEFNGALGRLVTGNQRNLHFGETVYLDETVITGPDSSTALLFIDETRLQVGANSTVVLDRFVYDPDTGKGEAIVDFGQGIFRYISGTMPKEQVTLRTPTTVMAIRGTTLIVYVAPDNTTQVAVIEGEVDVSPCGGTSVSAGAGFSASVSGDCQTAEVTPGVITPEDPAVIADLDFAAIAPAAGAPPEDDDDNGNDNDGGGAAGGGGAGPAGGGDPGGGDPGGGDPGGGDPGGGDPGGGDPGGGGDDGGDNDNDGGDNGDGDNGGDDNDGGNNDGGNNGNGDNDGGDDDNDGGDNDNDNDGG